MSPFAYLIPYANHHAFESAMGRKVYVDCLDDFMLAIPKSLGQHERDLLVNMWQAAWSRYSAQSGKPALG
jgi:hypothetical protein